MWLTNWPEIIGPGSGITAMNGSKRRGQRNGVAAVEFAFVAPVFFLLVLGLVEMGRMLMIQQSLTNAAREGCRMAVMGTTTSSSDVDSAVRNYLQSVTAKASDTAKLRVTAPANLANCPSGTSLKVGVEIDYMDVTWVPFGYLGVNPTIRAEQSGFRE
jgi:Flp pilus assembly protein TadG